MVASRKMQEGSTSYQRSCENNIQVATWKVRTKLEQETRKLFKEMGIKTVRFSLADFDSNASSIGLFPSFIKVDFLKTGHFLWFNLGGVDTTLVLPILAALFTFLSSWLSNKALPERNGATTAMMYGMPVIIFFWNICSKWCRSLLGGFKCLSSLANLLLNNPFKIIAEREADVQARRI